MDYETNYTTYSIDSIDSVTSGKVDRRRREYRNMKYKDTFDVDVSNATITSAESKEEENSGGELNIPLRSMGGRVQRSGSLGNNTGAISVQVPYIVINRPRLSLPENYGHYHGYPANLTRRLGSLRGYTRVSDIHLENIPATSSELSIIDTYLHSGVIINNSSHGEPTAFTLMVNNSDLNVINKDLTTVTSVASITLKEPTSVVNPTFILSGVSANNILTSNYIYYPGFDKYYFIRNKVSVHTDVWEIQCEVDAIETYRNEILNQTAVVSRQEYEYNLYLDDGTLKAYSDPYVQVKVFPTSFNDLGTEYIMVVLGQ